MNTPIFRGVAAAVVTPTDEKGVDYVSFARLLNFLIDSGADAIVVCGTTGESSTLSEDERREAIAFTVRQVRGRVPVIAGTGCNATDRCVSLSRYAADAGADALLVVTPYYNKCTQNGLLRHYEAVAGSTDKPIIVYNVPTRTCVNIEPRTYCELAKIPNIRAVKEASSSVVQAARTKRLCGDALDIYSGNDDLILPLLSIGGAGVILWRPTSSPKPSSGSPTCFSPAILRARRRRSLRCSIWPKRCSAKSTPSPSRRRCPRSASAATTCGCR